jgi:hypothetical protein
MANLLFFKQDVHTYTHGDKKVYDRLEIYFNTVENNVNYRYKKHVNLIVRSSEFYESLPQEIADIFNVKTVDLDQYNQFKKGA